MDSDGQRIDRIREIFCEAQSLPTEEECVSYIEEACCDDAALKKEVLSLLGVSQTSGDFLNHDASGSTFFEATDLSDSLIGNYHLIELIGEGGFGVVYMAEQSKPVVRRVALKVIKPEWIHERSSLDLRRNVKRLR